MKTLSLVKDATVFFCTNEIVHPTYNITNTKAMNNYQNARYVYAIFHNVPYITL